ncbi:MAG: response regulator, partial [Merismopedia sp. SIO2A8]|nr:response regulator [Merismopedia sp. SIO2A8]
MALDPVNAYYIRKLLRQNFDRLQSVVVKGAGPTINPLSDLNTVIENLYLDEEEVQEAIQELVQLVEMHKRISAQSQVNRQSLPELEAKIFWLLGFKEKKPGKKELILAVDDMADNLDLLEAFLSQQGYRSARAADGSTALDQARTLLPDLILLDVRMPGMSGFEVCHQLKQSALTQDIPVLFLSANTSSKDKVKGFD